MKNFAFFFLILLSFSASIFTQWQSDVRLTNSPGASITSEGYAWWIAASGDSVHVVWQDNRDGNNEIYYKRSVNGGAAWGADTRLTNNSEVSSYPSVAAAASYLYVAWADTRDGDYEIYYCRSTNGGTTWEANTRLTNSQGESWLPSITVLGSNIHLVWIDKRDGNFEVYYKHSTNSGINWSADTRLTNNPSNSYLATVTAYGSSVHAAWWDDRDGNREIYCKRSSSSGLVWGGDTRLTNDPGESNNASIGSSGQYVHLVWDDSRDGDVEIYYKRSTNAGVSWETDKRLTFSLGTSAFPSIAVSGINIHVIWRDNRDGNWEIYYKRSTDAGTTWGTDIRLTNNSGWSSEPSVALSGSVVHASWCDDRDGNWEIYYKKDPTGNPSHPPPLAPNLASPPNGSFNQPSSIRFIWYKSQFAATYRVQIAEDSLFNNTIYNDSTLSDSTVIVNLAVSKYYWWKVNAKNLYGTSPYSSVWKFGTFPVGIKQTGSGIPDKFELYSNYPNPFNPSTSIKFDVPKEANVKLSIFDLLGRKVTTLVNEKFKPGTYETEFDGTNYPSGVYFYKLETESFVQTRKMVLIK